MASLRFRRVCGRAACVLTVVALAACGSDDDAGAPAAADPDDVDVEELMNDACGKPSYRGCHVEYETVGDAQMITVKPNATEAGGRVLVTWAAVTGCIEEADFLRIEQTRALDGMVESANGRSTWTYHPDDGLTIVCEP